MMTATATSGDRVFRTGNATRVVGVVVVHMNPLMVLFRDRPEILYQVALADFTRAGLTPVLNGVYVAQVDPIASGVRAALSRIEPMVFKNGLWMIS